MLNSNLNSNSNPNRNSINNKFKKIFQQKEGKENYWSHFVFFRTDKMLGLQGMWLGGWSREVGGQGAGIWYMLPIYCTPSLYLSVLILYCTYCTYVMHSEAKHPANLFSFFFSFLFFFFFCLLAMLTKNFTYVARKTLC